MNRFKTKKGWLTLYALACGYIEQYEKNNVRVTMYKEPGCDVFQVRCHDFRKYEHRFWETFDNVTEARKLFAQTRKEIENA